MTVKAYLFSFPERFVRSALGLGAGVTRELGVVALPEGIRRSQLYQNLVDATLRYLIEQVGGVEGVYRAEGMLPDNFLKAQGLLEKDAQFTSVDQMLDGLERTSSRVAAAINRHAVSHGLQSAADETMSRRG